MNMMTEPLHRNDKALPQGLRVCPSYGTYNCGSQKTMVQLYNTKDHTIVIKKGTAVARMVAANEVPETVVTKVNFPGGHFSMKNIYGIFKKLPKCDKFICIESNNIFY